MPRTADSLQRFVALRNSLQQERAALQRRLKEIDAALGTESSSPAAAAAPARRGRPPGRPRATPAPGAPRRGPGRPPRNDLSMRDAIARAIESRPLAIRDIVDSMQRLGFIFKSKNPVNSVGAYLYGPEGKKHFKRADGKFSSK